jgi:hypothetical protein
MVYQASHGAGNEGYNHGGGGPNDAYFDKDPSGEDSPFEHYKDGDYNKKDDNSLGGDYNKNEEEGQNKEEEKHEDALMDNINKEEETKQDDESTDNVAKKAASELLHEQNSVRNDKGKGAKKKNKDHKSIEEAIKDASKDKKEVFVLE